MIIWIVIGILVIAVGGWGAFALWILPYPDTASLIPNKETRPGLMSKV